MLLYIECALCFLFSAESVYDNSDEKVFDKQAVKSQADGEYPHSELRACVRGASAVSQGRPCSVPRVAGLAGGLIRMEVCSPFCHSSSIGGLFDLTPVSHL